MSFRFALAPVLALRERAEDDARAWLRSAARDAAAGRARVARLRGEHALLARTLIEDATRHSPRAVRDTLVQAELLREALDRAESDAREATVREDAARNAYAEANRGRRQIEVLRDRARESARTAAERRDEIEREEAAVGASNAETAARRFVAFSAVRM